MRLLELLLLELLLLLPEGGSAGGSDRGMDATVGGGGDGDDGDGDTSSDDCGEGEGEGEGEEACRRRPSSEARMLVRCRMALFTRRPEELKASPSAPGEGEPSSPASFPLMVAAAPALWERPVGSSPFPWDP